MPIGHELLDQVQVMQKKIKRIEEILIKGIGATNEQIEFIHEYKDKIQQAINYINTFGEPAASILTLRYLCPHGETGRQLYWHEIAQRIHYDADYCRKIERKLRKMQDNRS